MELTTSKLRIEQILTEKGIKKADLARELGVERSSVTELLKSPGEAPIHYINAVAKLSGIPAEWIRVGGTRVYSYDPVDATYKMNDVQQEYLQGKTIRPITVVVDRAGKELIPYVAHRAQAGYTKGYGDPQYLDKLPAFALPIMKDNATYRMFEVHGDSMLQLGGGGLHDGDIVIAQYVEDFFSMRDNRVYVVVCESGVIVKRCLNRLKEEEPVLVCNSDNKNGNYKPIIVRPHEMIEVWELKAFISRQLSFSTDLWTMINDLQVQQARLNEKVESLDVKKLK